ncbi:MAG: lysostaphin resistance A-like protein [Planctomycetaceae bacterium]
MEVKILSLFVILSSLVWTWVALRKMRSKPVVVEAGAVETVPLVAIAFAVLWLIVSLGTQVVSLASQLSPPDEVDVATKEAGPRVDVDTVRKSVMQSGFLAFGLAAVYSLGVKTSDEAKAAGKKHLPAMRAISLGLAGFVASIGPVLVVQFGLSQLVEMPESSHALLELVGKKKSPDVVLWVGAAAVVAAPLLEELIYRVVLQGWLRSLVNRNTAIVVVAVAFSFVHGWPAMVGLIPLAIVLGVLYDRTNSYLAVVTAHAAFNMCMLLLSAVQSA